MPALLVASAAAGSASKARAGTARRGAQRVVAVPAAERLVDAAADAETLRTVRKTWTDAELLVFGEVLWELYRQRWESRGEDAPGLCDQLHLRHHRAGDYSVAAQAAAATLGKPFRA